jgi:preprotein translocase subunit YajC
MDILIAQTNSQPGSGIAAFLPMILIGLIFYYLILRPQTKEKKKIELEISNLKIGDKVLTRGGICGKIINFTGKNKQKVILESNGAVKLTVLRNYLTLDK